MTGVMLTRAWLAGLAAAAMVAVSPAPATSSSPDPMTVTIPARDCPVRAELGRTCLFNPVANINRSRVSGF